MLHLISRMWCGFSPYWSYLIPLSNHFMLTNCVFIVLTTKAAVELLKERVNQFSVKNDNDLVIFGPSSSTTLDL